MDLVTVSMPPQMVELIESELSYKDSRAGWVREAVFQRLERQGRAESLSEAVEREQ